MKYEADFYDQFIKYQKFSFFIKSIKFLYPSNLFLQYSKNLSYFNSSNLFYIIKFFKRILSFIFGLFSNSYSVFRENLKSTRDVLIISHHLKTDTFPQKDFYFGDLSLNLKKNKISFKKILINQSEISSNLLNKKNSTINVEAINKYCNFFIELKILFIQIRELLLVIFFHKNINTPKKFLFSVIFSIFEYETTFALRMYFLVGDYIKRYSPKVLIFTYEGYPWERMCIKAAKDSSNKITCIGYQHSIIYKGLNPLNRKLGSDFDPDIILASGGHSFKILKKSKNLKKVKILNAGNFTKGFKSKTNYRIIKNSKKKKCLVLPVGIYAECATLFNFTYKCALINKNIEYIWRLHPVIKINILRKMIKFDLNNLPKNIILSNNTLDKDAKKSDCVLYRSSTSAIQVLQYGCVPIYLEQEKQLRFDVVQDFKQKKIVKSFGGFIEAVNKINQKIKIQVKNNAINYEKNIYGKINYQKTFKLIKNLV